MSLTAIVVSHNYAKYLPKCLESCTRFCDEVLVYDDCSTDDSLEVIESFGIKAKQSDKNTGGPIWGSNLGIDETRTSHFVFVDADNFLLKQPPEDDIDYLFADVALANEHGHITDVWRYQSRPTEWSSALEFWIRDPRQIPVPWGGVWRTEFVQKHGLRWLDWQTPNFAPDMRTCIEWLMSKPTIAYRDNAHLAFRIHDGQMTGDDSRRRLVEEESCLLAASIGATLRSRGFGG